MKQCWEMQNICNLFINFQTREFEVNIRLHLVEAKSVLTKGCIEFVRLPATTLLLLNAGDKYLKQQTKFIRKLRNKNPINET
jgi:hypothetical protein